MRQREIDGFDAVVVFLALAGVTEAADAVVRLQAELFFQRMHKHAEHIEQHAVAAGLQHRQHFHIHQCGEDNGAGTIDFGGMVDLAYYLVRLVYGVDEGQADVVQLGFELRQDGVTKGFGGNAGAVGDKKYGAMGHGNGGDGLENGLAPYNARNLAHFPVPGLRTRTKTHGHAASAFANRF